MTSAECRFWGEFRRFVRENPAMLCATRVHLVCGPPTTPSPSLRKWINASLSPVVDRSGKEAHFELSIVGEWPIEQLAELLR